MQISHVIKKYRVTLLKNCAYKVHCCIYIYEETDYYEKAATHNASDY